VLWLERDGTTKPGFDHMRRQSANRQQATDLARPRVSPVIRTDGSARGAWPQILMIYLRWSSDYLNDYLLRYLLGSPAHRPLFNGY